VCVFQVKIVGVLEVGDNLFLRLEEEFHVDLEVCDLELVGVDLDGGLVVLDGLELADLAEFLVVLQFLDVVANQDLLHCVDVHSHQPRSRFERLVVVYYLVQQLLLYGFPQRRLNRRRGPRGSHNFCHF
jgi:hypothetical protein